MKQKKLLIFFLTSIILGIFTACSDRTTTPTIQASNDFNGTPPPPPPGGFHKGGFPPGPPPGGFAKNGFPPGPPPGGMHHKVITGKGAYVLKDGEVLDKGIYVSSKDDENAMRAQGKLSATLNDVTIKKTSGKASSNEGASFYGLNSAVLALNKAILNINGGSVSATTEGSTGVFAYNGATINIKDTKIDVTGGNAGGIEAAGGGKIYAKNLTVNSKGKAAIRSDRGGGEIFVDGGTYTTKGSDGAPAIYSTAKISVKNATLISNDSEAVVIEGLNSVKIVDSNVTGEMKDFNSKKNNENIHNVMLYQSMSGDSQIGTSTFTMIRGSLTSKSGDMFYITNTSSIINLEDVNLKLAKDSYLLLVAGNNSKRRWGRVGANGGSCKVNLRKQIISGDIKVDSISKLSLSISNSSTYTGAINADKTKALSLSVKIDDSSKWILTKDSYISELKGEKKNIVLNGHKLYIKGKVIN